MSTTISLPFEPYTAIESSLTPQEVFHRIMIIRGIVKNQLANAQSTEEKVEIVHAANRIFCTIQGAHLKATALIKLAMLEFRHPDLYEEGLKTLAGATFFCAQQNNPMQEALDFTVIGDLHLTHGIPQLGSKILSWAKNAAKRVPLAHSQAILLTHIAVTQLNHEQTLSDGRETFIDACQMTRQIPAPDERAERLHILAETALAKELVLQNVELSFEVEKILKESALTDKKRKAEEELTAEDAKSSKLE